MGRVTYEQMASHWPTSTDEYAAPMNEVPKVVFSTTLAQAPWPESSIGRGDLAEEIARTLETGTALHVSAPSGDVSPSRARPGAGAPSAGRRGRPAARGARARA
jgi:hypothetical protein